MGNPAQNTAALCPAQSGHRVWLLWELLHLRQCGEIMRLRIGPRNHLLHLFQPGQAELNTSCCHGTQHTGKHQLGNGVAGVGPRAVVSLTPPMLPANRTKSHPEVPRAGKLCCTSRPRI